MEKLNIKTLKETITQYNGIVNDYELTPIYDTRQSFYKKAIVKQFTTQNNTIKLLYSYNTLVCGIINDSYYILNTDIKEKLLFSTTTLRHIKEFLRQNTTRITYKLDSKTNIIKYNNVSFKDIEEGDM